MARDIQPAAHTGPGLPDAQDEALARALIAHEARAPQVAWQRFSPMVRRMIRRTLGPANDAEDLSQEVFLQLFAKIHELREPKVLKAFIISITTLTLCRELRRRKLRSWLGVRPDPAALDQRVVYPDPIARAALERFYTLLDRFVARERTAFILRVIEGVEVTEVAAALGVSLATAKRSIARVQKRMLAHVGRDPLLADYLGAAMRKSEPD
ncbi:MAG: sigma-70 family RNA polymerase sigma factor [Deltaproteobacteria bacterium]